MEKISKEMNVSQATMFLCFKKQLGIPIYKYITEKRLIYAYKLITEGNPPTKIYSECGYKDYATFYKAYVKMFGHPPSETK
ncbi:MAG: AraC family transcriptional regulator [Oscillospiraceae bacterium]|nr:AraC family transcriptional regulator [Oscillospiraceae bacterium]